jgi:hypothetical protein
MVIDRLYHGCADAVIEAFACHLPDKVNDMLTLKPVPPVWIDLEYMSAESWVDTHHAIVSLHPRPGSTRHYSSPALPSARAVSPARRA